MTVPLREGDPANLPPSRPAGGGGWRFVVTDSLEKVYPGRQPRPLDDSIRYSVFPGETASHQLAYHPPACSPPLDVDLRLEFSGPSTRHARLSVVELVPVELAAYPGHAEGYDSDRPGLYPDLLRPAPHGRLRPVPGQWRSAWIDLRVDDAAEAGIHRLGIRVLADGVEIHRDQLVVEVLAGPAPALELTNSHWLHADALADHYGVEVFSPAHWELIDRFLAKAAEMGANSVLTPVWTPPLDTAVDQYRTPVQLVDIHEDGSGYRLDFGRLHRWLDGCARAGIRRIEVSHLFTQWGAHACPAVYVDTPSGRQRRFGWDTPATDPAWRALLAVLLPQLQAILAERVGRDNVVFHLSDEPPADGVAGYLAAKAQVADLLEGWTVMDALGDIGFLDSGAVPTPIVATDAVGPFLAQRPDRLWVYYCMAQHDEVANRFIAMPSARSRVLGHQLFAAGVDGFLHWGFNFYYSLYARRLIDPFHDVCADGHLPGGDAFVVYPGPGGEPLESIRFKVLAQVAWDLRAMQALAARAGRQHVLDILDPHGELSFASYSPDPQHYLRVRAQLNADAFPDAAQAPTARATAS